MSSIFDPDTFIRLGRNFLVNKTDEELRVFLDGFDHLHVSKARGRSVGCGLICRNLFQSEGNKRAKHLPLAFERIMNDCGFFNKTDDHDIWFCLPRAYRQPFNYTNGSDKVSDWNPDLAYQLVLGTPPDKLYWLVEDFKGIESSFSITDVYEPMAAEASLCYYGQFDFPKLKYHMSDLNPKTKEESDSRKWVARNKYDLADVTKKTKKHANRDSTLVFLGKQSYCDLNPAQVQALIRNMINRGKYIHIESLFQHVNHNYGVTEVERPIWNLSDIKLVIRSGKPKHSTLNDPIMFELRQKKNRLEAYRSDTWRLYDLHTILFLLEAEGISQENIWLDCGNGIRPLLSKECNKDLKLAFKMGYERFVGIYCIAP